MAERKLRKVIENETKAVFEVSMEDGGMISVAVDRADLSDEMCENLIMHGLLQKVGDSAAGKEGQTAVDAMQRVVDQLLANQWKARKAGKKSLTKEEILDKVAKMSPEKQEEARALIEALGFKED